MNGLRKSVSPGESTPPTVAEKIEELEQRVRRLETYVLIIRESYKPRRKYDEADFV